MVTKTITTHEREIERLLDILRGAGNRVNREDSRRRLVAVYANQPADRLPILFDAPAHDVVVSADMHEQFYSADAMLLAHLQRMVATAAAPSDGQLCLRANVGVVLLPSVFGLEPEVPEDVMPRLRSHLTKADVLRFRLPPDITRLPLIARALDYSRYFQDRLGDLAHVYMPDTQGVFDVAHLVLGNDIFLEMYDDPPFVHHLLELCLQAYVEVTLAFKRALGEPLDGGYHGHGMVCGLALANGGVRVSEDTPTLLKGEHIDEFVAPYIARSLRPFGGGFLHYCGRNDHLLRALLALPEVHGINLGNPEKNDAGLYMNELLHHDKFYFGFWPRRPGEALGDYLQRMLDLVGSRRKGLIFLLTPGELGETPVQDAVKLWVDLQTKGEESIS